MLTNPDFGLKKSERQVGRWDTGLRAGWNRKTPKEPGAPIVYVHISEKGGLSTLSTPGPEEPVHDVVEQEAPSLGSSIAWRNLMRDGTALIQGKALNPSAFGSIVETIKAASVTPLTPEALSRAGHQRVEQMQQGLRNALNLRAPPAEMLRELYLPAMEVIEVYLGFGDTGEASAEVLAAILSAQCRLPSLWPPIMPVSARPAAIDQLASSVHHLLALRDRLNVEGYYQATFLAGLYARTAISLAKPPDFEGQSYTDDELLQILGHYEEGQHDRINKLAFNMDETFAHRIAPVFVLPALFVTFDLVPYLFGRAKADESQLKRDLEYFQLHPALRAAICEKRYLSAAPAAIADRFRMESEEMEEFDASASIKTVASPFSEEIRDSMKERLLTLMIARDLKPS